MSRDPFQPQDLQLVAPRRGCWNEGLGRESDQFRKAVRGKEGDIRKCFVSLLGESVVPELDVQEPARFAQAHDAGDISRGWSGGGMINSPERRRMTVTMRRRSAPKSGANRAAPKCFQRVFS